MSGLIADSGDEYELAMSMSRWGTCAYLAFQDRGLARTGDAGDIADIPLARQRKANTAKVLWQVRGRERQRIVCLVPGPAFAHVCRSLHPPRPAHTEARRRAVWTGPVPGRADAALQGREPGRGTVMLFRRSRGMHRNEFGCM